MSESKVTHSVGSWGHLIVNGIDLGKLVYTTVGNVGGLFGKEKKRREVKSKFDSGNFPTTTWNYFTDDRYTYDDNRYYECNGRTCSAHVRADKLTEVGWHF